MLTVQTVIIGVAVLVAIVGIWRARAAVREIERLSESYWELRYETGQLKARVTRLEIANGLRDAEPEADVPRAQSPTTFVPLSSLKK